MSTENNIPSLTYVIKMEKLGVFPEIFAEIENDTENEDVKNNVTNIQRIFNEIISQMKFTSC